MMNKPIYFITNKLREFREERDWTQQQLAEYLTMQLGKNVTQAMIAQWENQIRGLKADDAIDLAKAVRMPTGDLFERKNA